MITNLSANPFLNPTEVDRYMREPWLRPPCDTGQDGRATQEQIFDVHKMWRPGGHAATSTRQRQTGTIIKLGKAANSFLQGMVTQ
jgi:hypothetical protein